ncbi:MAG: sigma-70 family RNA polymerase sigma factor [Planctomycetota bacterium]
MTTSDTDDEQLLAGWRAGQDEVALQTLYARHARLVASTCRRCGSPDADEATQAVFMVLMRRSGSVPNRCLAGWLTITARRVVHHQHRAIQRRQHHEQEAAMKLACQPPELAESSSWDDARQHLDAALAQLSAGRREAVVRYFLEQKTQSVVATELGCSTEAVKTRVHEGLESLRAFFTRRGVPLSVAAISSGLATEIAAAEPNLMATFINVSATPSSNASATILAQKVCNAMLLNSITWTAAAVIVIGSGLTAALVLGADTQPPPPPTVNAQPELVELTNFRSGISLTIDGRLGRDYVVERLFHDAKADDHSVIYMRSGTKMSLAHNALNVYQVDSSSPFKQVGINGPDGKPDSGDEGIINFKIDRDQQTGSNWSAGYQDRGNTKSQQSCQAYVHPFSLADLEFEPGSKVIGSVGLQPGAVPGPNFYYRGQLDAYGDEWHSLTVADDDSSFQGAHYTHKHSSDGKVFLFVVDPKTPCLSVRALTDQAQFYTTPAKTYFLPRIHEQTTYIANDVELQLHNLCNERTIFYRIDQGEAQNYQAPLRSESFSDGAHVLEYWIDGGPHRTRAVVKNPVSPGAQETHPRLLWADDAELATIRARLGREPYKTIYDGSRTSAKGAGHTAIDAILGRGSRNWVSAALGNAFIAKIEGPEAKTPTGTRTFASYAKHVLLDNKLSFDPVGMELNHNFAPMPTAEWNAYGYYVVNEVYDLALAYDLLISFYRADQAPGGITPIEDLKIRDLLAHWIAIQTYELRGFESAPWPPRADPGVGMWDTARLSGAAVAAMAMPGYDTPYYGTSGFDGKSTAKHQGIPFTGQAFTWKELFIDANQEVATTPRLCRRFNQLDGGLITANGQFFDRRDYFANPLMGHCFQILANTAVRTCGKRWPLLERAFAHAAAGLLEGGKVADASDKGPAMFALPLIVNHQFPAIANLMRDNIDKQPVNYDNGRRNVNSRGYILYTVGVLGLIWYQDDIGKERP